MDKKESVILGKITKTLEDLLRGAHPSKITDKASEELEELISIINDLLDFSEQISTFLFSLSRGNLNENIPPRENLLASPFKELNSKLSQITYQAQQVAKGDYSQRLDFMGDFSKAFNEMVKSLEEKEKSLKESEAISRLNKQRLELAIHAANLAWWEWDVKTDMLNYDFRRTDMVGYNYDEYPKFAKEIQATIHPDDKKVFHEILDTHMKGKSPDFEHEYRIKNKDGNYIWVRDKGKVTEYDIMGAPSKVSGLIYDITDMKTSQLKLQESEKILRDSNTAKDKLFSIISHDLRGPIGSIYQFLDYVSSNPNQFSQDELQEVLISMRNSSKVTYEMLDNLLLWARSQGSKIEYKPDTVNAFEILVDTKTVLNSIAKNKELSIKINTKPDVFFYADKESIKTVLRNLLSNAIKYSNKGSNIILEAHKLPADKKVFFSVKDSGVGIPEQVLKRIFHFDIKFSTIGTSGEKGTGLGLLLCKEFVEANGGEISVTSKVNEGSTFSFTVPMP
jgi:PAS domain S-box-containing protein